MCALAEAGRDAVPLISERAEKGGRDMTTNLPFSEWTQCFRIRGCVKALLDRVDGSGAHHRDRRGVVPFRRNAGGQAEAEELNRAEERWRGMF